jgi:IS605 OrfB family transposase
MKKKKKLKNKNTFIDNRIIIPNKINKFPLLPIPSAIDRNIIKSFSWFDIVKNNLFNLNPYLLSVDKPDTLKDAEYKSIKIQIFPDSFQKYIIDHWIELYRQMLNHTIKHFRTTRFNLETTNINFYHVRELMKEKKWLLLLESDLYRTNMYAHSFDYATKDVCTNLKAALSNLKNQNIKHFRLRYIKQNKQSQIVKIEKTGIKIINGQVYNSTIGSIQSEKININIDSDMSIMKKNDRYFVLLPQKIKDKINKSNNEIIAFDVGIRTFLTGYNQHHTIEIGNNLTNKLSSRLDKIDKINLEITNNRKKRKAEAKQNRKMQNCIDDLHWKSINYMVKNYSGILIGNLSTKKIVQNKNLNKKTKRIAMIMSLYVFKKRLKYKCKASNKQYKLINESYTSKICSNCGNEKKEANTSKIYGCKKCHIKIDRDQNSGKNILLLGIK